MMMLSRTVTRTCIAVLAAWAICTFQGEARAQGLLFPTESLVTAKGCVSLSKFHPGSTGYVALKAEISEGWHINSNEPLDKYLVPTVLEVGAPEGVSVAGILYPGAGLVKLEFSETKMSLYEGSVVFGAIIRIAGGMPPGSYTIGAVLRYQACDNLTCVEPSSISIEIPFSVASISESVEMLHPEIFTRPPFVDGKGEPATAAPAGGRPAASGDTFGERGLFLTLVFVFIGGLALNLTPCIYPLIPITISFFGGQARGKASRTFLLALIYVFGMSVTYSVLGTIAASTGSLFGSALQNTAVIIFIAAVLIGFAASMFGLWEFRLPMFLTRRTGSARQGRLGALVMGLTVGIVAAPCIGPFVIGLLTYVGKLGKPALGFFLFFTLAWGMGIPFLVLAMISGNITHLPRSGDWMVWVRKIFGFVLVAMAFYFTRILLGSRLTCAAYGLTTLVAGIYLGWAGRSGKGGTTFVLVRRIVGVACMAVAVIVLLLPGGPFRSAAGRPGIDWVAYSGQLQDRASREGRPVMIDFSADWCIPCHELDHKSFSDEGVIELSKRVVTLEVDLTRSGERENEIKRRFKIQGVPTIIFIDGSGRELAELRVTGFVGPGEIRKRLEMVTRTE